MSLDNIDFFNLDFLSLQPLYKEALLGFVFNKKFLIRYPNFDYINSELQIAVSEGTSHLVGLMFFKSQWQSIELNLITPCLVLNTTTLVRFNIESEGIGYSTKQILKNLTPVEFMNYISYLHSCTKYIRTHQKDFNEGRVTVHPELVN